MYGSSIYIFRAIYWAYVVKKDGVERVWIIYIYIYLEQSIGHQIAMLEKGPATVARFSWTQNV